MKAKLIQDLKSISDFMRGSNDHISGNRIDQAVEYIEYLEKRIAEIRLQEKSNGSH